MSRSVQPDILFVIADDHRPDMLGLTDEPAAHTPTLDALAQQGFRFANHCTTTPICTPARAEVLTGVTTARNGVPWFGMPIDPSLTLMPQAFRDAGYHTIHVGKWHNDGHPRDKGYDQTRCVFRQDNLAHYEADGHQLRFAHDGGEVSGHSSTLFVDQMIEAMRRAPEDRPRFAYLAFHAPHDPFQSPEPFASMFVPAKLDLPPDYMPEHPVDNGEMTIRDELLLPHPRTPEAIRRYRTAYAGIVAHMDHELGRLIQHLRDAGRLDRTLIVYTSDHGLAVGSHGLLGKENMHEHSIRVPLLMRGPGVPQSASSTAMTHHVDLLPTLCELAGVDQPVTARDGQSLASLFAEPSHRLRDALLFTFQSQRPGEAVAPTQRAIRTERHKLMFHVRAQQYRLFDLHHDPHELADLLAPWRLNRPSERRGAYAPSPWSEPASWQEPEPTATRELAEQLRQRMIRMQQEANDPAAELTSQLGLCP